MSASAGLFAASVAFVEPAAAGVVSFKDNQLFIDNQPQPQMFGAEVQYFRLRGGTGRNVPREKVLELWNKALDRVVEAKMNAISFYVPWDFHEYAEGKFDFDGTVDEDGDGRPDYPSRDVRTFLKLVEAHGIKHIHIRPGPYVNAEWGFLGFGAVPLWFHQKFPKSHAQNPKGETSVLYSYVDPDFRRYSQTWLETVYREVLKPYIGPGRPIDFLQLDNETNYQWQSIYNHDYSPHAVDLYREFLKERYKTVAAVNTAHGRSWKSFDEMRPATEFGKNLAEDQDWYRWEDEQMHEYLHWIRTVWENAGVREPQVLFTLAESYNAADHGILPNYRYRNDPGVTGMQSVNLYPKTYETSDDTLMNNPFKADLDTKAADAANDFYFGSHQEWVMGPEIQAGWWKGTNVSLESRRQTYLTTIGHGMKAVFLYYFNEGDNWQSTWARDQIQPYYDALAKDDRYKDTPSDKLPDAFWDELNKTVAQKLFFQWNARWILPSGGTQPRTLYFDAPLSGDAEPRAPYAGVKEIGEKVNAAYGNFLGSATELTDDVCFVKDYHQHPPSSVPGLNSVIMNSDWAGGLLALFFQAGINPRIIQWDLNPISDFNGCRLVVYQDNAFVDPNLVPVLKSILKTGGGILNFLDDGLTSALLGQAQGSEATNPACTKLPALPMEVNGYKCAAGGGFVYQMQTPIYDVFNTDFYYKVPDAPARRDVVSRVLQDLGITSKLSIEGGGDRVVAFARKGADGRQFWITVKSARRDEYRGRIRLSAPDAKAVYRVTEVFTGSSVLITGDQLSTVGFDFDLGPQWSTAFFVEPATPLQVAAAHPARVKVH